MPKRLEAERVRIIRNWLAELESSGRRLPKSPLRGKSRANHVYVSAVARETGIPIVSLLRGETVRLLADAAARIGFDEDAPDIHAMAGKWIYLPDVARALGCTHGALMRMIEAGLFEARPHALSHKILVPDLRTVEVAGDISPFERMRIWAFGRKWSLAPGTIPSEDWFARYNRARGWTRLAASFLIPEDVVCAGCDFLWKVRQKPPTPLALVWLFYSRCNKETRRHEVRFLAIAKAWRARQTGYVPLLPVPFTCFDADAPDEVPAPPAPFLSWIGRIPEQDIRDALALLAVIQAAHKRNQHSVGAFLHGLHRRIIEIRAEVPDFDIFSAWPDDVIRRVYEGAICNATPARTRQLLPFIWTNAARVFELYAKPLGESDRQRLFAFALKVLQDQYYWRNLRPSRVLTTQQRKRRKEKVDGIVQRFPELRFEASIRLNICKRLRENCREAIARVQSGASALPYDFSYTERVIQTGRRHALAQTINLRLHSHRSLMEHLTERVLERFGSTGEVPSRIEPRAHSGDYGDSIFFVEYLGTQAKNDQGAVAPLWFLEILENRLHLESLRMKPTEQKRKAALLKAHGYDDVADLFRTPSGLLNHASDPSEPSRSSNWLLRRAREEFGMIFLPFEELYAAALYGCALFRAQSITGARIGEVLQAKAAKGALREEVIPLPNGRTKVLYVFRAVPKGHKELVDFFIDREAMENFVAVGRYARESAGITDPKAPLPIVKGYLESKVAPDRYVFQVRGRIVDTVSANSLYRFLFWGIVDGIDTHSVRHAVANQLDQLGVDDDVIAKMLNQKDVATTRYYKEPTRHQIIRASELLFVETIDWTLRPAGVARKTAEENAKFLDNLAAGQERSGALTEVTGGFCTVIKSCAAHFSCINCPGKVPDPAKRPQVITKRSEAESRREWAAAEGLLQEEKQARMAIADCNAELEEMDLIEMARADAAQPTVFEEG